MQINLFAFTSDTKYLFPFQMKPIICSFKIAVKKMMLSLALPTLHNKTLRKNNLT
jgi:hypothetical protein